MRNQSVQPLERIRELAPYAPGLSIDEIRAKYGLSQIIKLASNENPLGASPLAVEAIRAEAPGVFRYPRGGNPDLAAALSARHKVSPERIAIGNGSDEIIDLCVRMLAQPGEDNIVCFQPCFSIYPIQAAIAGVETRRVPLNSDFSFDFDALLARTDDKTRIVFITTPDNPSGYCPPLADVMDLCETLAARRPRALLFVDEAYMDFARAEKNHSLLANHTFPDNVAVCRTFSKSWGLAGMRVGYAILPLPLADAFWRARLPFSVNILAEKAALAALKDIPFREATLRTVHSGRKFLQEGLRGLGCEVLPSEANFLMFKLPAGSITATDCFEALLREGIIIRPLKSYGLPEHMRVSAGNENENAIFLKAMKKLLGGK